MKPAAICLKDVDIETIEKNIDTIEEELVKAHQIPPSDIECLSILPSERDGTYVKFMQPEVLPSKEPVEAMNRSLPKDDNFKNTSVHDAGKFYFFNILPDGASTREFLVRRICRPSPSFFEEEFFRCVYFKYFVSKCMCLVFWFLSWTFRITTIDGGIFSSKNSIQ